MAITKIPDNFRFWRRGRVNQGCLVQQMSARTAWEAWGIQGWFSEWFTRLDTKLDSRTSAKFSANIAARWFTRWFAKNARRFPSSCHRQDRRQGARVKNAAEKTEWLPEDFAAAFLDWVAATYPVVSAGTISSSDIAVSYFPRFRCRHLASPLTQAYILQTRRSSTVSGQARRPLHLADSV
jgi:hypothetical protein